MSSSDSSDHCHNNLLYITADLSFVIISLPVAVSSFVEMYPNRASFMVLLMQNCIV